MSHVKAHGTSANHSEIMAEQCAGRIIRGPEAAAHLGAAILFGGEEGSGVVYDWSLVLNTAPGNTYPTPPVKPETINYRTFRPQATTEEQPQQGEQS